MTSDRSRVVADGGVDIEEAGRDRVSTTCGDCDERVVVINGPDEVLLCSNCGAVLYEPDADQAVATDGGFPQPLQEAHERALAAFEGSEAHIPDDLRETLEEHGVDVPEDLEPLVGGIRGGLHREDLPMAVHTILEEVPGLVEISIEPADENGHHWQIEWERVQSDDWGSWGEFQPASEVDGEGST